MSFKHGLPFDTIGANGTMFVRPESPLAVEEQKRLTERQTIIAQLREIEVSMEQTHDSDAQKALAQQMWDGIIALRKVTKMSDDVFEPASSATKTMMYYFGPQVGVEREDSDQISNPAETLPGKGGEPISDDIATNPGFKKPRKAA